MEYDCKLLFPDGLEIFGYAFGAKKNIVCEIVFNTSMVGYQEILSDPSYTYQAVVMTYPLIGNYGMMEDDYECKHPSLGALIVSEVNHQITHEHSYASLSMIMKEYGIPGIFGVDTRMITRHIRKYGTSKVYLCDIDTPKEEGLAILQQTAILKNAVAKVSTNYIYRKEVTNSLFKIVAIDCGIKENIIRCFHQRKCSVIVVPYNTDYDTIVNLNPDGIFISNGPGDPHDVGELIQTVKKLHGKFPIFGICLGHQIIGLSYGASCYKLKFGHRGGNHPVKNIKKDAIEITSQNHSYAIDKDSLMHTSLQITHINLLDETVEGFENKEDYVLSVQYHPESAPGPEDSHYLFDEFIKVMEDYKNAKKNRS